MKNLFTYLLLGVTIIIQAQNVEFKKKNFEDQEGFKTAFQALKDGDKKFFAADYSQAIVFYKTAHNFNPENAKLNFKMGVAYLKSEEKEKSLTYFLKAKELDPNVDPKINFALAQAYQENKQYKTAINTYKGYLTNLSASEKPSLEPKVQEKIKECEAAGGMDSVTEVVEEPVAELKKEDVIEEPAPEPVEEVKVAVVAPVIVEEPVEEIVEEVKEEPVEEKVVVAPVPVIVEKPVVVEKTKPNSSATTYRVQLVATSRNLSPSEIKKLYSGSKKVDIDKVNGVNKYLVGKFNSKSEAQAYTKNVNAKGAFVVKYKDGKRVY